MGKKKVLIIDDEVDFCLLMRFYLSKKNCDVQISHTLRDGLGQVKAQSPDIVILDNNLPDGLGWPSAQNIMDEVPEAHLFLISANKPTKPDISNGEKQGDNGDGSGNSHFHIVEKPISITQIDNFLKP
jgi:two-component system OmpR family response regulator